MTVPKLKRKTVQVPVPSFSSVMSSIGSLASLVAIVFAVIVANDAGFVDRVLPRPEPVPVVEQAGPVTVKVYGPSELLQGGEYFFHLEVQGDAGVPKWTLVPNTPNALTVFPDGKTARFQTAVPGTYALFVSVAGSAKFVASDFFEFENLIAEEPAPPQPEPQNDMPPPIPDEPEVIEVTSAELIDHAIDNVHTDNLQEEAAIVAESIRAFLKRLGTGNVDPEADVMSEIATHASERLGGGAKNWGLFFAEVDSILTTLREQGDVTTAATSEPFLRQVVAELMIHPYR